MLQGSPGLKVGNKVNIELPRMWQLSRLPSTKLRSPARFLHLGEILHSSPFHRSMGTFESLRPVLPLVFLLYGWKHTFPFGA